MLTSGVNCIYVNPCIGAHVGGYACVCVSVTSSRCGVSFGVSLVLVFRLFSASTSSCQHTDKHERHKQCVNTGVICRGGLVRGRRAEEERSDRKATTARFLMKNIQTLCAGLARRVNFTVLPAGIIFKERKRAPVWGHLPARRNIFVSARLKKHTINLLIVMSGTNT